MLIPPDTVIDRLAGIRYGIWFGSRIMSWAEDPPSTFSFVTDTEVTPVNGDNVEIIEERDIFLANVFFS